MAIPFFVAVSMIVVPPIDDPQKMDCAKQINSEAQRIAEKSTKRLDETRKSTTNALQELGKKKVSIMADSIKKFVDNFSRIKNVRLTDSIGLEELRSFNPDSPDFLDMKKKSLDFSDVATGLAGGVAGGTATAAGVYSSVGAFSTASTGAAVTNATLAWITDSLSLVMHECPGVPPMGFRVVLGGLVAVPPLVIMGLLFGPKAEKALNEAKENREKALKYEQDAKNLCTAMEAIGARADQITALLNDLDKKFRPLVNGMISILDRCGVDWRNYSQNEKDTIGMATQLAKIIKVVVDTSLITEDGKLKDAETAKVLSDGRALLNG